MRRPALALALSLAGGGLAVVQPAWTASNSVPSSTAVYRATTVTGASAVSINYTITAETITTVTARLQKVDLLLTTVVTAEFGGEAPLQCVAGVITILDLVTNLGQADYTCTGFTERADRPRPLTITAS